VTESPRAAFYLALAESLAEPPDWMSAPGSDWLLSESLTALIPLWDKARHSLDLAAGLPAEEPTLRRERYAALFGAGRPRYWLYESAARTGKILGEQTFQMARLYQSVGVEVNGAELPDHISLELAFLAFLAERDASAEKQFLDQHADWMMDLGRALQKSGDNVYAFIGGLLADWIKDALQAEAPIPLNVVSAPRAALLPSVPAPEDCTLCGFCAQVCPTRALKVLEDRRNTALVLYAAECIHCQKCERVCDFHALTMTPTLDPNLPRIENGGQVLRLSPLEHCPQCGKPIASRAELRFIAAQVGDAAWQHLCLDCRAKHLV